MYIYKYHSIQSNSATEKPHPHIKKIISCTTKRAQYIEESKTKIIEQMFYGDLIENCRIHPVSTARPRKHEPVTNSTISRISTNIFKKIKK